MPGRTRIPHTVVVSLPLPEPTDRHASRAQVLLGYLDYFRPVLVTKVQELPDDELRASRLPSSWTPLELLKHLTYVELRWLRACTVMRGVHDCAPWMSRRSDRVCHPGSPIVVH